MPILIPRYANEAIDPRRRALLVGALRAGLIGPVAAISSPGASAGLLGNSPGKLPPGRSIYSVKGETLVNGAAANLETPIKPGDTVVTGRAARVIFVVGENAHILRENSRIELPTETDAAGALRVFTGVLLSVFGRRKRRLATPSVTIGIRGTGVYIEAAPDESYVCTCFGTADLVPTESNEVEETVVSEHHDAPRVIARGNASSKRVRPAPFRNHTDLEVALIEGLVGRVPPFAFTLDQFDSPFNSY